MNDLIKILITAAVSGIAGLAIGVALERARYSEAANILRNRLYPELAKNFDKLVGFYRITNRELFIKGEKPSIDGLLEIPKQWNTEVFDYAKKNPMDFGKLEEHLLIERLYTSLEKTLTTADNAEIVILVREALDEFRKAYRSSSFQSDVFYSLIEGMSRIHLV